MALADILSPYPAEAMQAYEVSSLVNHPPMKALKWLSPVSKKSPSSVTYQAQLVTFLRGSDGTLT